MRNCQKIKNAAANIWRKFRTKKSSPSPRRLVSVNYGFYCAVAKINRELGGIGYRIIPEPKCGVWDIIITLDILSRLGESVSRTGSPANRNISNQKKHHPQTHRFAVFRCGSDGRIIPWCIWDVDLCGGRIIDSYFVQNATEKSIQAVARRAFYIGHRPQKTYYMTWQGQIERIDWLGVLRQESRVHLADNFHDLKEVEVYASKM